MRCSAASWSSATTREDGTVGRALHQLVPHGHADLSRLKQPQPSPRFPRHAPHVPRPPPPVCSPPTGRHHILHALLPYAIKRLPHVKLDQPPNPSRASPPTRGQFGSLLSLRCPWQRGPLLDAVPPPRSSSNWANHFRMAELSVMGRVSPPRQGLGEKDGYPCLDLLGDGSFVQEIIHHVQEACRPPRLLHQRP